MITALVLLSVATASVATTAAAASRVDGAHPPAAAGLNVPQLPVWTRNTIRYACDRGRSLTVRYINTKNEQSFALLSVKGKPMLFVNVAAASGARYVAGQYSWWTKGPTGDLRDQMRDADAPPLLGNCRARR